MYRVFFSGPKKVIRDCEILMDGIESSFLSFLCSPPGPQHPNTHFRSLIIPNVPFSMACVLFGCRRYSGAPSSLRQVIRGSGCPWALQNRLAFSPSLATTSPDDSSSLMSGGTEIDQFSRCSVYRRSRMALHPAGIDRKLLLGRLSAMPAQLLHNL